MKTQPVDFEPRKWPSQARSRQTFNAIVESCARLLCAHGYSAVTTNHIADTAGVGIASLYEYFPGKDAIVAQVAGALVERVMGRLQIQMSRILALPKQQAMREWIEQIYHTLYEEKALVAVFVYQVPYFSQLRQQRAIVPLLLQFSQAAADRAGVRFDHPRAELYLLNNLVSSSILQMLLEPPPDVAVEDLIAALTRQVERWLTN